MIKEIIIMMIIGTLVVGFLKVYDWWPIWSWKNE